VSKRQWKDAHELDTTALDTAGLIELSALATDRVTMDTHLSGGSIGVNFVTVLFGNISVISRIGKDDTANGTSFLGS